MMEGKNKWEKIIEERKKEKKRREREDINLGDKL